MAETLFPVDLTLPLNLGRAVLRTSLQWPMTVEAEAMAKLTLVASPVIERELLAWLNSGRLSGIVS